MRIAELLEAKGRIVATIALDDLVSEAIDMLAEWKVGALVVSADKEHIQGIISERDIVRSLAKDNESTLRLHVSDLMTKEVVHCSLEDTVEQVMIIMTKNRIRHVPVVDDDSLAGIVSIGDVVNARLVELEAEKSAMHDYITLGR